jgi:hypothetical protein
MNRSRHCCKAGSQSSRGVHPSLRGTGGSARHRGERNGPYAQSASPGWSATPNAGVFLEYYGTISGHPVDQNTKYFDGG